MTSLCYNSRMSHHTQMYHFGTYSEKLQFSHIWRLYNHNQMLSPCMHRLETAHTWSARQ